MTRTVLLTGATGTVGSALLDELAESGARVRTLIRDESQADDLRARGATVFTGNLDAPQSLAPAFDGVEDLWLLTPNSPRAPENNMNALWAARNAGVERVVRLSATGAAHDAPTRSGRLHALSDRETAESDMYWTILRPYWFMQNLLNEAAEIASSDRFSLNMGTARVGMIDARDIASCAARILRDPPAQHHRRIYTLTGPRSLSFEAAAAGVSQALNRTVRYQPIDDDTKGAALLSYGLSPWMIEMLEEYANAYVNGWGDATTPTVAELLGRAPRDISDFADDYKSAFSPTVKPAV